MAEAEVKRVPRLNLPWRVTTPAEHAAGALGPLLAAQWPILSVSTARVSVVDSENKLVCICTTADQAKAVAEWSDRRSPVEGTSR